ncbi:MAG: response regulator transcription factor [Ferruginibacter sp.]
MHKTILLADDHILLRDALVNLLNKFKDFSVLKVAGDGTEVIREIEAGHVPDIVILDLNMPKMNGFETASWLNQHYPDIQILILTMYDSEIAFIRLLQIGVKGFLKKDIHATDLNNALISVARGGYYYSNDTTGKLGTLFQKNTDSSKPLGKSLLSEIEMDFLRYACTEMTYKEIALKMELSPRVIDNYRDALFDKLNVRSRVGLVLYGIKNCVVTF